MKNKTPDTGANRDASPDAPVCPKQALANLLEHLPDYPTHPSLGKEGEPINHDTKIMADYALDLLTYIQSIPADDLPKKRVRGSAEITALTAAMKKKLARGEPVHQEMKNFVATQACTLDWVFNTVLQNSYFDIETHIDAERLRVALLAQRQSDYAVRTFEKIENSAKELKEQKNDRNNKRLAAKTPPRTGRAYQKIKTLA